MLHTYSSSKIALILFFRNKMKSHMNISFLWLLLARKTCTVVKLDDRHFILQKRNKNKKRLLVILTESKSVAFSLLFSIHVLLLRTLGIILQNLY